EIQLLVEPVDAVTTSTDARDSRLADVAVKARQSTGSRIRSHRGIKKRTVGGTSVHDPLHPGAIEGRRAILDEPLLGERAHDRVDSRIPAVFSLDAHGVSRVADSFVDRKDL